LEALVFLVDGFSDLDVIDVAAALTCVLTTASSRNPIHNRSDTPTRDCCVRRMNGDAVGIILLGGDSIIWERVREQILRERIDG
jgi:hypothetical protein